MAQIDRLSGLVGNTAIKTPTRVATTGPITLSGEQTIDGIAVVTGDRVLVKDQADATENGIYTADTGDWDRAADFDGNLDITTGTLVTVNYGTTNENTYWRVSSTSPVTIGTSDIDLAPALISDAATVSFLQSGTGAVARTMQSKERDIVSVKDFGALGDGATNDYAAIAAAIAAHGSTRAIYFPAGTYVVNTALPWTVPLAFYGEGKNRSLIKAGALMTAIISGSTTIGDTNNTSRSMFRGIGLIGTSFASYGFRGVTNHSTWQDVRVYGTSTVAMQIGYGWCNQFYDLMLDNNQGDGLDLYTLGNQANNALCVGVKCYINSGFGFISAGYGTSFFGCLAETNAKGGMYFPNGSRGLTIHGCYFEGNGSTGYTFTSPTSTTIKADIILNGSATLTTIAAATPCYADIKGCYTTPPSGGCFVFAPGAGALNIEGCYSNDSTVPLIQYYGNNAASATPSYGSPVNLRVGQNFGFAEVTLTPMGANAISFVETSAATHRVSNSRIITKETRNIAVTDMNQWVNVGASAGGTWERSATAFDGNPDTPVWSLVWATATSSHVFGFSIDTASYPQFHNKLMCFAIWTKDPFTADGNADVYVRSVQMSGSFTSNTNVWVLKGGLFVMPTSGTIFFGVRKLGAGGTIHAACPVLCEFGADVELLIGQYGKQKEFLGSAAPTTGTWKQADRVWKTNVAAGGTPGYVCTTAGTPGTWKDMATVAP